MRTESKTVLFSLLLVGLLSIPAIAVADGSCHRFLAEKAKEGRGGWYALELTVHREDISSVSYGGDTVGWLVPEPDGGFVGHSDQIFSERMSEEQQPFAIAYADNINLKLGRTGRLQIDRVYVSGESVMAAADDSWDLSCKGSLLTAYVPHFGVVTLSFRDLHAPAR